MDKFVTISYTFAATQLLLAGLSLGSLVPADTEDVTCYSCVYSYHPEADTSCLHNPQPAQSVRCHYSRFCTITRQWMKAEQVVRSFTRGCELKQDRQQTCIEDVHFNTCQSFCRTNLCNDGLGDLSNKDHRRKLPVLNKTSSSPQPAKTRANNVGLREPGPHHVTRLTHGIKRVRNNSNRAKHDVTVMWTVAAALCLIKFVL